MDSDDNRAELTIQFSGLNITENFPDESSGLSQEVHDRRQQYIWELTKHVGGLNVELDEDEKDKVFKQAVNSSEIVDNLDESKITQIAQQSAEALVDNIIYARDSELTEDSSLG